MTTDTVTAKNLDGYDAPIIAWDKVKSALDGDITQAPGTGGPDRYTSWLATTNADGSPHVVPLGTWWQDDKVYFTSGPGTRKSKNLKRDSRAVITMATVPFDLMVEGKVRRVTDEALLERMAKVANEGGWPASVKDGAFTAEFSAPAAGPPPWHVYELVPDTVYAMGTAEPYGATRFDL